MSDVFWAGDERAGDLFTAGAFVAAMAAVEGAWLTALVSAGIAPPPAAAGLAGLTLGELNLGDDDVRAIAGAAEGVGNPVVGLVRILRERLAARHPIAAEWIHRGLTSQDVVDTALMLCVRDVLDRLSAELADQIGSLTGLSDAHRDTVMAGRTLTQFAVPITFGLKAATWLQGILDAADALAEVRGGLRGQFGGAAGTMAAGTDLAGSGQGALALATEANRLLGLADVVPWHTARAPITGIGDALVGCTDAWGHLAADVILLSRPEIAELSEPAGEGRGSSSTMPQKRNPILSVLIRRAALAAPMLGAQLHLAAADSTDERPAGAWHTEWATLHTLARRAVTAGSQASELLRGLAPDPARMAATVEAACPGILAERLIPQLATILTPTGTPLGAGLARQLVLTAGSTADLRRWTAELVPGKILDELLDPRNYLGTTALTIDSVLARARRHRLLEEK